MIRQDLIALFCVPPGTQIRLRDYDPGWAVVLTRRCWSSRSHPERLTHQKLPAGKRDEAFWEACYADINAFEWHLVRNGTLVLTFFLNVSKKEQKRRFLERLENPEKHWKFSAADLAERGFWERFVQRSTA